VRLFFAALPSQEDRRRLESRVGALRLPLDARRVPAANYHMTLAFAGEVSQAQAAALRTVCAAARLPAFEVCFGAYEYWQRSEVVVAAASSGPPSLLTLHRWLRAEFDRLGLPGDPVPFRAHVTIARRVTQAPVLPAMSQLCWSVQAVHLVHSARSTAASVYTVVDTWPLLDKERRAE
jgi:2'-5' RNA ligase